MSQNLDQAVLSGDENLIDEAIEGMELDEALLFGDSDDEEFGQDDANQNIEAANTPEAESNLPEVIDTTVPVEAAEGSEAPAGDQNGEQNNTGYTEIDGKLYVEVNPDNAVVASKNGQHTIPYEVLARNRDQSSKLQEELEKARDELSQATTAQQKNEILVKQLEEAGITPDRLPEEMLNDPEAMNTIIDEIDGPAGQIIAAMFNKIQSSQQPQQSQQAGSEPQSDPLDAPELAELKGWLNSDKDRWDMAVSIDAKLTNDPKFAGATMEERFAEVQKLVKESFQDPVAEGVKNELQNQKQGNQQQPPAQQQQQQSPNAQIPNSPSSLSGGNLDTKAAARQSMLDQDVHTLEAAMDGMSPDDLEALLMEAGESL